MPRQTKPRLATWKKLNSTLLLQHPRMSIIEDDVELPDGNTTKYIYQTGIRDGVTVIAVDGDQVLIQQEYSYPPNMIMHQFPGGGIENGETPEQAAIRELGEESGYTGTPTYLGFYYPRNRLSSSKMHVVSVSNVKTVKKEGGDAEEFITSEWVTFKKLRSMIAGGEIVNFSILAGMSFYNAKNTTQ